MGAQPPPAAPGWARPLELEHRATPLRQPQERRQYDSCRIPKCGLQGPPRALAYLGGNDESAEPAPHCSAPVKGHRSRGLRRRLRKKIMSKSQHQFRRFFKGPPFQQVPVGLFVTRTAHFHERARKILIGVCVRRQSGCGPVVTDGQSHTLVRATLPVFIRHAPQEIALNRPRVARQDQLGCAGDHVCVVLAIVGIPRAPDHRFQAHGAGSPGWGRRSGQFLAVCTSARIHTTSPSTS